MSRRLSARDFLAKSEWEGGLYELLVSDELSVESVPEGIEKLWGDAHTVSARLKRILDEIMGVVEALDHEEYLRGHE